MPCNYYDVLLGVITEGSFGVLSVLAYDTNPAYVATVPAPGFYAGQALLPTTVAVTLPVPCSQPLLATASADLVHDISQGAPANRVAVSTSAHVLAAKHEQVDLNRVGVYLDTTSGGYPSASPIYYQPDATITVRCKSMT